MFPKTSLLMSQSLLEIMGTKVFVYHRDRIPQETPAIVITNHRSAMDAFITIAVLEGKVRFACHHYMGQVPIMREIVDLLGCFPLEKPQQRKQHFFKQATNLLKVQQWVGIFPEGGEPMLNLTKPTEVGKFERGFAHLALRTPLPNLAILPVAIASVEETIEQGLPIRFLRLFDPKEPLVDRSGLHTMVFYNRVNVAIGRPYWITEKDKQQYRGKQAKKAIEEITAYCQQEISTLVTWGCNLYLT